MQTQVDVLWSEILESVAHKVDASQYSIWIRQMNCLGLTPQQVTLGFRSNYHRVWFQKRYLAIFQEALRTHLGTIPPIEMLLLESASGRAAEHPALPVAPGADGDAGISHGPDDLLPQTHDPNDPNETDDGDALPILEPDQLLRSLNSQYTFENFVVGPCNRFSHAAALAITENPLRVYNPYFLHSSPGLGKTHLLQAICRDFVKKNPKAKIVYLSCESFVNQFISAVEKRDLENFRYRYRQADLLLIDDIHFLADKERTQEEFFHTFNTLYHANKQIVLSSDSSPREIPTLEERLVSRFQSGLVVKIDAPAWETRIAIIRKKVSLKNRNFPDDVVNFIAENFTSNVRELEGAVIKVISYSSLNNEPINSELAKRALQGLVAPPHHIHFSNIMSSVSEAFQIKISELTGKRKTKSLVVPRQVCMYLAKTMTELSLEEIGGQLGGRDHTTVLHGVMKVRERIARDDRFSVMVEELGQSIAVRA